MMKPEIKAKWVAALRSGNYKQGKGQLRDNDEYCCLGVLCDIHARETTTPWLETEARFFAWQYRGEDLVLPSAVVEWAGLPKCDPRLDGTACSVRNDTMRQSFTTIADLIDANL